MPWTAAGHNSTAHTLLPLEVSHRNQRHMDRTECKRPIGTTRRLEKPRLLTDERLPLTVKMPPALRGGVILQQMYVSDQVEAEGHQLALLLWGSDLV